MNDRYVYRPRPRSDAALRLFCFTPAGYGASIYREWGNALPAHVDVCAVRLPGRENLRSEPLLTDFNALIAKAASIVEPYLDRPFALFGHSMGSFVAFEVSRFLRAHHAIGPSHLFVSGRRAPQIPATHAPIHHLPQPEFIGEIQRRYNGIPQAVLNEPELLELTLPILRADLAALDSYRYVAAEPLNCRLFCYSGTEDHDVSLADLEEWSAQTKMSFELRRFSGDHFYMTGTSAPQLRAEIAARLS